MPVKTVSEKIDLMLKDFESKEYSSDQDKKNRLKTLIASLVDEQVLITKQTCANNVTTLAGRGEGHPQVFMSEFRDACFRD